ncbi:hypothetical protein QTP88_006399 [Uroleucon formosanum]
MFIFACSQLLMIIVHVTSGYNYTTNYITVSVNHFSYANNDTFKLKYLMNDKYWNVNKGPIFFYTGNEGRIEDFCDNTGFMWEISREFEALVVFAEHRYYGESMPYGMNSFDDKLKLSYLTSQQAMADFVDLIKYLRNGALSVGRRPNPVFAFGGSYGGMLAAWFRIKYPATVEGAIASSAPIWQFTGMTPCNDFFKVTSSVYRNASAECGLTISTSWNTIDKVTESDSGKMWLTENWKLCESLESSGDVAQLKYWATNVYVALAMVNYPYEANFLAPLPANPIKEVCKSMRDHTEYDKTLLMSVFNGLSVYFNYTGSAKCLNLSSAFSDDIMKGWGYQACTEMIMPLCTKGGEDDIFEAYPWDFEGYVEYCENRYGVKPTTDDVEKQYGGKNLKAASNIIFSNGLLDPWSSGGVLKSISSSVRALLIPDGAHHLDLRASHKNDTSSVIRARKTIKHWISKWIFDYRYRK